MSVCKMRSTSGVIACSHKQKWGLCMHSLGAVLAGNVYRERTYIPSLTTYTGKRSQWSWDFVCYCQLDCTCVRTFLVESDLAPAWQWSLTPAHLRKQHATTGGNIRFAVAKASEPRQYSAWGASQVSPVWDFYATWVGSWQWPPVNLQVKVRLTSLHRLGAAFATTWCSAA